MTLKPSAFNCASVNDIQFFGNLSRVDALPSIGPTDMPFDTQTVLPPLLDDDADDDADADTTVVVGEAPDADVPVLAADPPHAARPSVASTATAAATTNDPDPRNRRMSLLGICSVGQRESTQLGARWTVKACPRVAPDAAREGA